MTIKNFLKQQREKRKYIRHPANIAIEYKISGESIRQTDFTKDISFGGLCFQAKSCIEAGTILTLRFPEINKDIEVAGKIVWCSHKKDHAVIGVQFLDEYEADRARIIEEICHLKNFQKKTFEKEGVN